MKEGVEACQDALWHCSKSTNLLDSVDIAADFQRVDRMSWPIHNLFKWIIELPS